jgi:chromosome segregation ATPase
MSDYEDAISQLTSTMQQKLSELQSEKFAQINKRNNLSGRLADLRKSKLEILNFIKYLQDQIKILTESSSSLEEEKSKLSIELKSYADKITSIAEQAKTEKISWAKESDYWKSKLSHIESQHRIEAEEEEKILKIKAQEAIRLEAELKAVCDELSENQSKLNYKRSLERSRVEHLEQRSKILDSIYKTT